jgi:hypothetical protein
VNNERSEFNSDCCWIILVNFCWNAFYCRDISFAWQTIRNAITLIIGLGVLSIILSTIGAGLVFVKPEEGEW